MTPLPHHPSVASQASRDRWQQVAKLIRDLCESSGWPVSQTQAELAVAAVWDLLLCTPEERELLDAVAENPRPDIDVDALFAEIAAKDAVVDAAVAETRAEEHSLRATTKALTAHRRSFAIDLADSARDAATAARAARRDAVQRLLQLRQDTE